jgi:spore photoproduct lyase
MVQAQGKHDAIERMTMRDVYRPQHVWIDREVVDSPITANVVRALAGVPTTVVDAPPALSLPSAPAARLTTAKKHLYLTAQRGQFVRPCPGASSRNDEGQLCCGYMIVDVISNCDYECTYCYLQSYLNVPYLTVYANLEKLFDDIATLLGGQPQGQVRMGSGEFSDSLSLDSLTGLSGLLVPFVRQFPNLLFEFKTKSDWVDGLLDHDPRGRVMVSWSLNPEPVVRREEHKTAPLAARLQAARRCRDAGYLIGLHFDPLLYYPGWEADYEPFVDQVFDVLSPQEIATVSMGSLRFAPGLKAVVRKRFPKSGIMDAELLPGFDGKVRYFKPLRVEMYTRMLTWLRRYIDDTQLYLCMESQDVWRQVYGRAPTCSLEVEQRIQARGGAAHHAANGLIPLNRLASGPR